MKSVNDCFELDGRVALITGGGTGLGKQFASALSAAGATVILAARRKDKLEATAKELNRQGGNARAVSMDVTDSSSMAEAFDQMADLGTPSVLVNNAGLARGSLLVDTSEDDWNQVLDTNLTGVWLVAKEAVRRLIDAQQSASIINIASILGAAAQKGNADYCASKAGVISLTKTMSLEWARYGIRVNAIAPGYFASDLAQSFLDSEVGQRMIKRIPQRRLGEAGELNGALLLLASDASAYMTGTVITVDGGHSVLTVA